MSHTYADFRIVRIGCERLRIGCERLRIDLSHFRITMWHFRIGCERLRIVESASESTFRIEMRMLTGIQTLPDDRLECTSSIAMTDLGSDTGECFDPRVPRRGEQEQTAEYSNSSNLDLWRGRAVEFFLYCEFTK